MDDQRFGTAIRRIRLRRGWTQQEVAGAAGVSRSTVSRVERGHLAELAVATLRNIAGALDVRVQLVARWRGGELDRLLGAGHAAMHEQLARRFTELPGWEHAAEVSFSMYGERGSIDILAWHPARGVLLVIELKTEITDVQALLSQVDRYRRLAPSIARARGWEATTASCWVVVADTRSNRRRHAAHANVLRSAYPADGRLIRRWLRDPRTPVAALSFLTDDRPRNAGRDRSTGIRVRELGSRRG